MLSFCGSNADKGHEPPGLRKRAGGTGAGHYYCLVPKLGQIWSWGSVRPFKDFPVNPMWITDYVQGGKIGVDVARSEYIKCGKNLDYNLRNLQRYVSEQRDAALQKRIRSVQQQLQAQVCDRRRYPQIEAWLGAQRILSMRQRFFFLCWMGHRAWERPCLQ